MINNFICRIIILFKLLARNNSHSNNQKLIDRTGRESGALLQSCDGRPGEAEDLRSGPRGLPLVPKVPKMPKMPKIPCLLPFIPWLFHLSTFGTSLFFLLVLDLIMWSRKPISKLLPQEMGRGWEWAGDIGEKSMQISFDATSVPLCLSTVPKMPKMPFDFCQKYQT